MRRRYLFAVVLAALAPAAGAVAATTLGTSRGETLRGTAGADVIKGGAGADRVLGGRGGDLLVGGPGRDVVDAGPGGDTVRVRDGARDLVGCGPGRDLVVADRLDVVRRDCEVLDRGRTGQAPSPPAFPPVAAPPLPPAPPAAPPPPPPPPPPAIGSTRANPLPLGWTGTVADGWRVTVLGVVPDATALVLAAESSNEPPAPGRQYVLVRLSATYVGSSPPDSFVARSRLQIVGASGLGYDGFGSSCGYLPSALPDGPVFAGGTVTGDVCWSVPSAELPGALLVDGELPNTYFALG